MAQNRSRYVGEIMRDCPAKANQGGENDEEDWSQGWPEASPDVSCSPARAATDGTSFDFHTNQTRGGKCWKRCWLTKSMSSPKYQYQYQYQIAISTLVKHPIGPDTTTKDLKCCKILFGFGPKSNSVYFLPTLLVQFIGFAKALMSFRLASLNSTSPSSPV